MEPNQYHENYHLGILAGQAMEQQRIIKLLDDLHLEVGQIAHIANRLSECKTCQAIALIKGEK